MACSSPSSSDTWKLYLELQMNSEEEGEEAELEDRLLEMACCIASSSDTWELLYSLSCSRRRRGG
jgi:hypothetical protein